MGVFARVGQRALEGQVQLRAVWRKRQSLKSAIEMSPCRDRGKRAPYRIVGALEQWLQPLRNPSQEHAAVCGNVEQRGTGFVADDECAVTPGKDPDVAFAYGLGVMTMANGRPYRNRYVFRFETAGGKIRRIREYANAVTSAIAFGLPLPQSRDNGLADSFT